MLLPVLRGVRDALPGVPISVDTRKPEVAAAALDAGADLLNDVGGRDRRRRAWPPGGARGVPYVLMHDRQLRDVPGARSRSVLADLDGCRGAGGRARAAHATRSSSIRASASGRTPRAEPGAAARPGASCASSGCRCSWARAASPPSGACSTCRPTSGSRARSRRRRWASPRGVDIVRVHDVRANVRVARMADAIVRGLERPDPPRSAIVTDDPIPSCCRACASRAVHGVTDEERALPQLLEVDLEVEADLSRAAGAPTTSRTRSTTGRSSRSAGGWSRTAASGCWRRSRARSPIEVLAVPRCRGGHGPGAQARGARRRGPGLRAGGAPGRSA